MKKYICMWMILKLNPPSKSGKPKCKKGTIRYYLYVFFYKEFLKLEGLSVG